MGKLLTESELKTIRAIGRHGKNNFDCNLIISQLLEHIDAMKEENTRLRAIVETPVKLPNADLFTNIHVFSSANKKAIIKHGLTVAQDE